MAGLGDYCFRWGHLHSNQVACITTVTYLLAGWSFRPVRGSYPSGYQHPIFSIRQAALSHVICCDSRSLHPATVLQMPFCKGGFWFLPPGKLRCFSAASSLLNLSLTIPFLVFTTRVKLMWAFSGNGPGSGDINLIAGCCVVNHLPRWSSCKLHVAGFSVKYSNMTGGNIRRAISVQFFQ